MIPLFIFIGAITVFVGFLFARAIRLREVLILPLEKKELKIEKEACLKRLSRGIQIETVSYPERSLMDQKAFNLMKTLISSEYRDLFTKMEEIQIEAEAMVYCWKGKTSKEPLLLTAHLDVVPVNPEQIDNWSYDPFSGAIEEGYIWGRGTLDIKSQAFAILEALSALKKEGFQPQTDIYIAFGMDEEIGGEMGAQKVSEHFQKEGISFGMVLDEGGAVTENSLKGIQRPIGVIGVGEKGQMNVEIIAKSMGGHASMPTSKDPLVRLMKAGVFLDKHPFPLRLVDPVRQMLLRLAPHMSFGERFILANLFLFKPLFLKIFQKSKTGNAMLRTTMAYTMIYGSSAPNVLPQEAKWNINMRLLHGDSPETAEQRLREQLQSFDVSLVKKRWDPPSKLSSTEGKAFALLERVIRTHFEDAIITPYLMMAGSDALHYEKNASYVYRFSPYQIEDKELSKMHGNDECISISNYLRMIQFYGTLLKNWERE